MDVSQDPVALGVQHRWCIVPAAVHAGDEKTVGMDADPHAALRHALRNHLTTVRGWAQLHIREGNKPVPDAARQAHYATNLEAAMTALDQASAQHLGPRCTATDADGDATDVGRLSTRPGALRYGPCGALWRWPGEGSR